MTVSKLTIYNGALRFLGETELSSLTEDTPSRYKLDGAYDDEFLKHILMEGLWNFATRTAKLEYDSAIDPGFGHEYVHPYPDDFVRLVALASDEYFSNPLNQPDYRVEASNFFTSLQTVYIRYVSNDASYGLDFSAWPANFTLYAECALAVRAGLPIGRNRELRNDLMKECARLSVEARATDAMAQGTAFPPPGSWTSARHGNRGWGRRRQQGPVSFS